MSFETVTIGPAVLYRGDALEVLPSIDKAALCLMDPPYELKHVDGGGFAAARQFYAGGALNGIDSFDLPRFADELEIAADQFVAFHSRDQIRAWAEFAVSRFGNYDRCR